LGKLAAVVRFVQVKFGGCMVFCGRLWLLVEAECFDVNPVF
jgi:hypothetical protein